MAKLGVTEASANLIEIIEGCRVCLGTEKLSSIFNTLCGVQLSLLIEELFQTKILEDDRLPTSICSRCSMRIKLFAKLKSKFLETQNALKAIIQEHESVEIVKSEDGREELLAKNETEEKMNESLSECENEKGDANVPQVGKRRRTYKTQCVECGKILSSRYRLKMHMLTHSGEKPYACDACDKRFSLLQNLKVHKLLHSGEKPYNCSKCGRSFRHRAGIVAHLRGHNGEMPYSCPLCSERFRVSGQLQYHIKKHTNERAYQCEKCDKSFRTASDLKKHQLVHTKERHYMCSVCGMTFLRNYHLHRHTKTHENSRTFNCEICKVKLFNAKMLESHLAKKH